MRILTATLSSVSPYGQSRHIQSAKSRDETHEEFEARTWRERMHVTKDGKMMIPPMAFKNCLSEAAKYKSVQIAGKGKATYTKHFEAGVLVTEPLHLPITKKDLQGEWVFVPSDGQRGGGRRVLKCFPLIPHWEGEVNFYILDDIITEEVFKQVLETSGSLIGIGRFRPRNMGYYGRFKIVSMQFGSV